MLYSMRYPKGTVIELTEPIEDTGCNSVATGASTGVFFGLAVAAVVKSDPRLCVYDFSGAVYIFISCKFE